MKCSVLAAGKGALTREIHREAFLPLHLALHSFAKQSIRRREQDPQDKTPLYCSQVSFSALAGDDLLSGPQVSQENTWIPGIPLSSQTGGKILDPGSLLLSPPPKEMGRSVWSWEAGGRWYG